MRFVDGEPGLLAQFFMWILDGIYDFYYKHWGWRRWSFGDKWNAMIERLDFEIQMRQIKENWDKGLRGNGEP